MEKIEVSRVLLPMHTYLQSHLGHLIECSCVSIGDTVGHKSTGGFWLLARFICNSQDILTDPRMKPISNENYRLLASGGEGGGRGWWWVQHWGITKLHKSTAKFSNCDKLERRASGNPPDAGSDLLLPQVGRARMRTFMPRFTGTSRMYMYPP